MQKIVFILGTIYGQGGLARVTINIANELVKTLEYDITMISYAQKHIDAKLFFSIDERISLIDLPIPNFNIRKHTLKAANELRKLYDKDFDGTFVIDDVGSSIPAWLGLHHCKKANFICWTHTNFFNGSRWGFSGWGKRLAVKKFNYVVSLTKEDKGYYEKILKAKNVVQIYNPKDTGIVKSTYDVNSKKIITVGALIKERQYDVLVKIASHVFENRSDWTWDFYGDGKEKENLKQLIKKYGLEDKVRLMGYSCDILNCYKDYAFYVFASTGEGCPLAMIEAMSAGLPMLSFDFKCGPKDLILDRENGYIVPCGQDEMMENRILHLMDNADERIRLSQNSDMSLKELEMEYVINQWKTIL